MCVLFLWNIVLFVIDLAAELFKQGIDFRFVEAIAAVAGFDCFFDLGIRNDPEGGFHITDITGIVDGDGAVNFFIFADLGQMFQVLFQIRTRIFDLVSLLFAVFIPGNIPASEPLSLPLLLM